MIKLSFHLKVLKNVKVIEKNVKLGFVFSQIIT